MSSQEPARVAEPGRKPRRGEWVELSVESLDRRGFGRGFYRTEGLELPVRVRHGLPGSRVRGRWHGKRKGAFEVQLGEVLEPSPDAVEAPCAHFGTCGGCTFQHLAYPAQLVVLEAGVRSALTDHLAGARFDSIVGAEAIWNYRNKMDFTFASRRWVEPDEPQDAERDFALGLHVPGRFDKVLDVHSCKIHFAEADGILSSLRTLARARGIAPWDCIGHTGLLRHVVLRKGFRTGEVMVDLVTSDDAPAEVEPLAAELLRRHPEISTLVQNVNTRPAAIAVGEREHVLHGPGVIHEEVAGLSFALSANSFFQTNTEQCDRLFAMVREEAQLRPTDVVYDLYCGTGAIGLALSADAGMVHGWETVTDAVADAERNAERNGVQNAVFHAGDVLAGLATRLEAGIPDPDVVILDPPRSGLHPKVAPAVVDLGPRRIVYVSCNVHAAAGDLPSLEAGGYHLRHVRSIDMFPHTPHVECVLTLERD